MPEVLQTPTSVSVLGFLAHASPLIRRLHNSPPPPPPHTHTHPLGLNRLRAPPPPPRS
jgi:hypothetical protein